MKPFWINTLIVIWIIFIIIFLSEDIFAFNKLKSGFEDITNSYLVPLSHAVAGFCFLGYVTLSFFRQEEYQKKVGSVLGLAILGAVGLELIKIIIQSFS